MSEKEQLLEALGERLRRTRLKKDLTQEALGFAAGLHRTFISELERGVRNPSVWTLHRLAKALGVRLRDLVP